MSRGRPRKRGARYHRASRPQVRNASTTWTGKTRSVDIARGLYARLARTPARTLWTVTVEIASGTGELIQVVGPVIDVRFPAARLPEIYGALTVLNDDGDAVIAEVQQHIGNNAVRAIAMASTDGLRRGAAVKDLGGPPTLPLGTGTVGRLFHLTGEPTA